MSIWELFTQNHYALLGLFYKNLTVHDSYLTVESTIPGERNWEYLGYASPYPFPLSNVQTIYTNQLVPSMEYELVYKDVWLVKPLSSVAEEVANSDYEVIEVQQPHDIEHFCNLFLDAYSQESDIYGKLAPQYKTQMKQSFLNNETSAIFYYVMYRGTPCATFVLSFLGNYCYAYCLGVIPEFRGRGISNYIYQYRELLAAKNDCHAIVLQTIEDSFVANIALKNGFIALDTFGLYTRKN